jgi:hypothetical protein
VSTFSVLTLAYCSDHADALRALTQRGFGEELLDLSNLESALNFC